MFKFLFGGKSSTPEVAIETDRARFERLVGELNAMIDDLPVKPRVTVDPATGHVLPETPAQFTDEAPALPAPDAAAPVAVAVSEAEALGARAAEVKDAPADDAAMPEPAAGAEHVDGADGGHADGAKADSADVDAPAQEDTPAPQAKAS